MTNKRSTRPTTIAKGKPSTNKSPFFKLPPELRNRIYRLLFSGNAIQVSHPYKARAGTHFFLAREYEFHTDDCFLSFKRLDLSQPRRELLFKAVGAAHSRNGQTAEDDLQDLRQEYAFEMEAKKNMTQVNLPVQLLRTCRQILAEAGLILYAENAFIFHQGLNSNVHKILQDYMGPDQRKAIRSAVVFDAEQSSWQSDFPTLNDLNQFLPGLKRLWIKVTLYPFGLRFIPSHLYSMSPKDLLEYADQVLNERYAHPQAGLSGIKDLHLDSATVHLKLGGVSIPKKMTSEKESRVAEKLEKILLDGKTGEDSKSDAEGLENR